MKINLLQRFHHPECPPRQNVHPAEYLEGRQYCFPSFVIERIMHLWCNFGATFLGWKIRKTLSEMLRKGFLPKKKRRERDSNSWAALGDYTLSRRASSATRASLPTQFWCANIRLIFLHTKALSILFVNKKSGSIWGEKFEFISGNLHWFSSSKWG